jgi:hypothetical protein
MHTHNLISLLICIEEEDRRDLAQPGWQDSGADRLACKE